MQLKLGDDYVEIESVSTAEWDALLATPAVPTLLRFIQEYQRHTIVRIREHLNLAQYPQAHGCEGYAQCLEELAGLLDGGLEESLQEERESRKQ